MAMEVQQQQMQDLIKNVTEKCNDKCSGTSVSAANVRLCVCEKIPVRDLTFFFCLTKWQKKQKPMSFHFIFRGFSPPFFHTQGNTLDKREQGCFSMCMDRYIDTMQTVNQALLARQNR